MNESEKNVLNKMLSSYLSTDFDNEKSIIFIRLKEIFSLFLL